MCLMEDKSDKKEKTQNNEMKQEDTDHTISRPKNFSFYRRREAYYFSNCSPRGILVRVPIKNGTYKMDEQKTVEEEFSEEEIQNKFLFDVPLNVSGSSKVNKNKSAANDYNPQESAYWEQKRESHLKSPDEFAKNVQSILCLNNLAASESNKNSSKAENNDQDSMTIINLDQKEKSFKQFKTFWKKKLQSKLLKDIDSEKLKGSVSDDKYKKFSLSNKRNISLKKPELLDDSNKCLSEECAEKDLTKKLSKMSIKTPTTEL